MTSKSRYCWILTALLLLISTENAQAVIIGTGQVGIAGGGRIQPIFPIKFQLEFGGSLLFDLELTSADIGSTYTLDAGAGSLFTDAVTLLTNGTLDTFIYKASIGHASTWIQTNEGAVFFGDASGANGIDFATHPLKDNIYALTFTVGDITVDPDGSNYFGIPNFSVRGTLDVHATPEPSTWCVWAFAGIAGVLYARRRCRKV